MEGDEVEEEESEEEEEEELELLAASDDGDGVGTSEQIKSIGYANRLLMIHGLHANN